MNGVVSSACMTQSDDLSDGASSASARHVWQFAIGVSTAVAAKLIELLLPGQPNPWPKRIITAIGVLAGLYALYTLWRWVLPRMRAGATERRIQRQVREPLFALVAQFSESMSQSFVRSAGNILNPLTAAKAIDAQSHYQCQSHLATLFSAAAWLREDLRAGRISAGLGAYRLLDLQRNYVRMCISLAAAVSAANRSDLHRSWDEIREHANALTRRVCDLHQQVQIMRGLDASSMYLETIPRSFNGAA